MRRAIAIVGSVVMLGAGVFAAVALAGSATTFDLSTSTDVSTDTSTGTSTGTSTDTSTSTSTQTSTVSQSGSKVWLCHHTGSKKHPYHLIRVSTHAVPAHLRHGDFAPGANNSCQPTPPASTVDTSTTTTTTSSGNDSSHGNNGKGKGKLDSGETETNDD
jgi:cytoskeletal protein RodZ